MATGHTGKFLKNKAVATTGSRGKTSVVTVGELRSSFKIVEAKLAKGMRVQITRRGEVVAEMHAPASEQGVASATPEAMPDFESRLKRIWGDRPLNIDTTALISEGRERDRLS